MKFRHLCGAVALALACIFLIPAGQLSVSADTTALPYYLALGDSLAQGVQPDSTGNGIPTNQGYVDDIFARYQAQVPGLQLAKLGCSGETTGTMRRGGACPFVGSQLTSAVAFLKTHHVVLITIDIGADDLDGCLRQNNVVDPVCLVRGLGSIIGDFPPILSTLRQSAGPTVPIVGMNYYDPLLANWQQGFRGAAFAVASVPLSVAFNAIIDGLYGIFKIPVADVQSSFKTTDFSLTSHMNLPTSVYELCSLSWMCTPPPRGPNVHTNTAGYAVIAVTFVKIIGKL